MTAPPPNGPDGLLQACQRLLDAVPSPLWIADAQGACKYFNQRWREFTGRSLEGCLGDRWLTCIHPYDVERFLAEYRRAIATGEKFELEFRLLHGGGSYRWMTCSLSTCDHGFIGTLVDIDARVQAESELRVALNHKRALLEHMPDAAFLKDAHGRYVAVNEAFQRASGRTREQLIGTTDDAHYPPATAAAFRRSDLQAMARGRSVIEEPHVWPDGRSRWVETIKSRVEGGGVVGVARDITDRRTAALRLEESEARYRSLFDHHPDAVFSFDREGNFVSANPACETLSGYGPTELLGTSFAPLLIPELLPDAHAQFVAALNGQATRYETAIRHKDGRRVDIYVTNIPIVVRGEVTGVYGIAQDLTAQHDLEEQLRQAQRIEAVGKLAGGVAHDFNNLITVIRLHGDFLLEQTPEGDERREDIVEIGKAAGRAARLTGQLLAFSRKQLLAPKPVDLNVTVRELTGMLKRLIGEDVKVTTSLATQLGTVFVDPAQMEQVLVNLAVNARDAMIGGGQLAIETRDATIDAAYAARHRGMLPGRYVVLTVRDTGVGMSPDVKERIFEPFFTTKARGQGTGLGLATVYGIVKQSNGYIWCESEPGRGTEFQIFLPLCEERIAEPSRAEALPAVDGTETVLLAEDEDAIRSLAERALIRRGYTVLSARNGAEALQVAARHAGRIDALLTDAVMPEMGGAELARRLREARPGVRVLYMSGYTDDEVIRRGLLDETSLLLQKPFTAEELALRVRSALDQWNEATSRRS